jgi:hypothetical protein
MIQGRPYCVSGTLEPAGTLRGLLCREYVHESIGECIELVGLHDVPVQAGRHELREDVYPFYAGIDAIGNRDVDQPVFTEEAYRWLGSFQCEWKQPFTTTASQYECGNILHRSNHFHELIRNE